MVPSTNSPGWSTNGSSIVAVTSEVKSSCWAFGSICEYLWFSKTLKSAPTLRSTLEGWI